MRKIVTLITVFTILLQLTAVRQDVKQEENFEAVKWQKLPLEDFNEDTSVVGTWNDKEYVIRIQMLSLDLDMKLIFPKGSKNLNGPHLGKDPPNLEKILKCKELPEYPENMTCSEYQVFKRKEPGLITRAATMMKNTWSFMVTKIVEAWKICPNGVGTMVKSICNGTKWITQWGCKVFSGLVDWVDGIWKGLMNWVGKLRNGLKGLTEWVFLTMMWADECVYQGSLWLIEWYSNNTEWLTGLTWDGMEWISDQTEWLAGISKEIASWLAENAWSGSQWLAEWAWGETKRFADWSWKAIKRNCTPLQPALEYVLGMAEVFIKFYKEYVHKHLLAIQTHLIISTWRETGYTISAALVMSCVVLTVYKLTSWPVRSIWRRWKAYKEWKEAEEASWRLPPRRRSQPKKRVWENPKKKKLYRNKN